MLSSDRLRTFAVFAEDQNLSRAAKRLHLSQPAVHAQLKGLSEELGGIPLYQRSGRGLVLTKEGVEIAAFARELEERTTEVVARLRGESATARKVILAAGAGALVHLLAPGLRSFSSRSGSSARHRSSNERSRTITKGVSTSVLSSPPTTTRVEVVTADAKQAVELVRSGAVHVGVGVLDAPPADLEVHTLAVATQCAVMPVDHPLVISRSASHDSARGAAAASRARRSRASPSSGGGGSRSASQGASSRAPGSAAAAAAAVSSGLRLIELAEEPIIAPPEGGPQRAALDAAFAARKITMHVSAVARGWDVVLKLAFVGLGIGIVNDTCAIPRGLVAIPLRELPTATYRAFTRPRPRSDVSELVRALREGIPNA